VGLRSAGLLRRRKRQKRSVLLSVIEHGAMMLAVASDDEVSEAKNRCVKITIREG